jgi:hypothetical protein
MLKFYDSLSEKDQRRYAAIEAKKLGHGGIKYISELFGCHRNTIRGGKNELENTAREKFNEPLIRVIPKHKEEATDDIREKGERG